MPITASPDTDPIGDDTGWREDLRFFLTCYAAGTLFFLIMLS